MSGRHDERGAVIVMMAIAMVLLLGVTALTVDYGIGRAKKRQIQNGADSGSLGGAQFLVEGFAGNSADLDDAEARAQLLLSQNIGDYQPNTTSCTDANPLANLGPNPNDCISFDTSFTRIRVLSPTQSFDTLLGRIFDIDTLRTKAVAEAQVGPIGFGTVLPFGLGSNFQLPEGCLKTQPGGQVVPPCTGPIEGAFGFMDVRMYGNAGLETTERACNPISNADQLLRLLNNIAIGIDHQLSEYEGTEARDPMCVPFPNTIQVSTGNIQQPITDGLVKADPGSAIDDGLGARLRRGPWPKSTYLQRQIDNKPMYEFIPQGVTLSDIPNSCQRQGFDTIVQSFPQPQQREIIHGQLQKCFFEYRCNRVDQDPTNLNDGACNGPRAMVDGIVDATPLPECGFDGCNGVVFAANSDPFGDEGDIDLFDIQLTPRFAYVPQWIEAIPGPGGSVDMHVDHFRAVYLQRLDSGCTGQAGGSCAHQFEPGPWNQGANGQANDSVDALTAFVFETDMLPGTLGDGPNQVGVNLSIRLVL